MRRFSYPLLITLALLCFTTSVFAQLFPGMRVNGRVVSQGDTVNVCKGSSLYYTTTASGFTSVSWKFKMGTPATSTSSLPQNIAYNTVGVDSTLQVISNGVNSDSIFIYVRVSDERPTAAFAFSPDNVCGNIPVSFGNNSTGFRNIYQWTFGDGTTTNATNPTHQFLNAIGPAGSQIYNVKLVTTNFYGCKDSVTRPVTIKKIPDAAIGNSDPGVIFNPVNSTFKVCTITPSYVYQFINQSTTIGTNTSYKIEWGDGTGDTTFTSWPIGSIIKHEYTIGFKTMTVSVTGPDGCIGIKKYTIFLGTNPAGGFSSLGNTNICAPDSLRFVITGFQNNSPGTTYTVTVNDGSLPQVFTHPPPDTITHFFQYSSCGTTSSNGTISFANSYNATLTIENPCDLTSVSVIPIYVSGKPRASILVQPSNTVCTGSNTLIRSTSTYGGIVTSIGGGNSTCTNSGKQVWVISPATGFTLTSGSLGSLNNNTLNGFVWTSGSTQLNAVFNTTGTYRIKLYVFNERCGIDSIEQNICVRNPPVASFTMSNKAACLTGSTKITNTSTPGLCLGDTYNWQVTYIDPLGCGSPGNNNYRFINGTNSSSFEPELQFDVPGKYIIELTTSPIGTSFSCQPASKKDTFTVKGLPKVSINTIPSICANNSILPIAVVSPCYADSALQYLWTFTNGNPGTAITPVPGAIAYSQLGTHPITLTVTSECGATTGNGSVDIIAPPIAAAGSDKTICSDGTTSIGSGGSPGITYQWTPITGISSPASAVTDISLQYTGANADTTLTYVLRASAGVDCFSTDTVLITIQKRPTIIAKTADNTICEGSSTQLTVLGASSYLWSPAGSLNSNTGDTVLASPPASTIYAVIGTAANGCTDTTTVTVNIQAYPATDAGADSTVCNNTTSVQLVGFPAGGTWSGNNITPAGLFNPQAAGNGVYTLKYTAALNQCSKQDSTVITVIDPPVANAGTDTSVCQNSTPIAFTGLPAGGTWSGNAFITPNGTFTPTTAGSYQLIYTFGGGSCISKDTITVLVKDAISNNSISPSQSVCINTQPAIINGLVANGGDGTPAYQWQQSADSTNWVDIASATSVNYTPPVLVNTTWYRRLAFTTLCAGTQGSISNPVKITVRENSIAEFTAGKTLSCIPFDLSTVINTVTYPDRNGTYQWFANDVSIGSNSTGVFPGYTISTQADSVTIKLITLSQYGCKPDTQTIQFFTAATSFARFAKDTAGGCGPLTVDFTNTSSIINNNIQFFWDFGNGQLSNLAQPLPVVFNTSAYFNDTTYYITLKTYNGCDTTIWKDSVKVRSNPNARFGLLSTEGCSPFTVNINNTSLGGPNTYYWDFGNGDKDTTYTTGLVTYTYNIGNNPDTVTITLIALNECGSDTSQIDVRIAPNVIRPQVNINSSQLFGCSPHTVGFINSTSGATRYVWNFGDGAAPVITNNSQNVVTHTYTDTGTFTIRIDMSNGCSDTSVFRQVTVYPSPVANFTTSAAIYCLGDTITVNNSSSNATNYRWFWGDGQTSVSANPVHLYATAGNYTVYLRAERSNSNGLVCYDTLVRPITVLVRPNVSIQSNIAPVNCAPFTLALAAPGIINETATWLIYDSTATPGIITITGATAQYTFNKPGTFSAKLVASNTLGCTDSATVTFTVKGTPQASFTPGNFSICTTDTTIAYTNTSTYNDIGPLSYRWIVDNLQRSVNGNFTHRYTAPAGAILPLTFTTQLIVSNTVGCSDTASAILQMSPSATAAFSIANANACVPYNLAITDASRFATRYRWFVNNVLADTTANPTIIITQPATAYSIRLIADNIYGCTPDTVDVNFITRSKPAARFTLNDTLGCTGVLNTVTNNRSTNANAYTWDWGDNSPRSNFVNPTHLYGTQGQYLITLIATDGTCSDTSSQLVRVSLKPTVDFSADNTLTCDTARVKFSNLTQNASNYTWYFSDGGSSTSAEPFHAFAPSITPYTVKLVADNGLGCKDSLTKPNLITAKVPPPGDFFISPNATISYPNYTFSFNNLTPASNNYTYQWNLGDGTFASTRDVVNHKYGDTGNYAVQLVVLDAASQCLDTTTRIARIDGFPGYLYVPNAICPNCMQSNVREFMPKGKGLAQYRLQILTTWGELIFETTSLDADGAPNKAWDGRVKGQLVQQDVYVWRIDAKFKNGTEWLGMIYPGDSKYKKAGTITVVK